jgi:hypothetical protein
MDKAIKKINVTESGCWEWQAGRNKQGYGKIGRVIDGKLKHFSAHRFFYQDLVGEIPEGMQVMHICDNPPCCNPSHLKLGTAADNIKDCVEKGRNYKGPKPWAGWKAKPEDHPLAKITAEDAKTARHLYFAERRTLKEIGDFFGIAFQTVSKIIHNQRFKAQVAT